MQEIGIAKNGMIKTEYFAAIEGVIEVEHSWVGEYRNDVVEGGID